eukprot:tig00000227_g19834.t1
MVGGVPKIADFGRRRPAEGGSEAGDVASFGYLLWEALSGRDPWAGLARDRERDELYPGASAADAGVGRPEVEAGWPEPLRALLAACWHADPARRPSFQQVVERLTSACKHLSRANSAPVELEIHVAPGESVAGAVARAHSGQTIRLAPGSRQDLSPIVGGSRALLEDCDISSAGWSGVVVRGEGTEPTLRENEIHGCGGAGVRFQAGAGGLAEGNDVYGNAHAGVSIEGEADPTVRNNAIHDGRSAGVVVCDFGRGTVEHNDIR